MFSNKKIATVLFLIFQLGFFGIASAQDIAVNISGPKVITTGGSVTYTIYVTNNGPTNATNVTVKAPDALNITETTVTYATGPGNGSSSTTPTAGSVTLANLQGINGIVIPSLPSGSAGVFTVVGTASSTVANINYTATVSFGGTDPNTTNNTVTFVTNVYATASCGATATYTLDLALTASNNSVALNGGTINLYFSRTGAVIPGLANPLIIPVAYSDLNSYSGTNHQWYSIANTPSYGVELGMATYNVLNVVQTADPGSVYNGLPATNTEPAPGLLHYPAGAAQRMDSSFTNALLLGTIQPLGTFTLSFGNLNLPTGVRISSESLILQGRGSEAAVEFTNYSYSGNWAKPMIQNGSQEGAGLSVSLDTEMEFGQTYTWRYSAYETTGSPRQTNRRGVVFKSSTITFTTVTPTPTITTTAPTCSANGTATISNYVAGTTYIFSPTGPTVAAGGVISAMTAGITYTITATASGCQSNASDEFSVAASTSLAGTTAPLFNNYIVGDYGYVKVNSAYGIACGSTTADLSVLVASPAAPAGTTVTWHSATPATDANKLTPAEVSALTGATRKVYAAFWDSVNGCYSPTKMITVYAALCAADDDYTATPIVFGVGGTLPSIFANDTYKGIQLSTLPPNSVEWLPEDWTPVNAQVDLTNAATYGVLTIPATLPPGIYEYLYSINDNSPDAVPHTSKSTALVRFRVVACTNPPNTNPSTDFTKTGISDIAGFQGGAVGWPGNVPNGFIAIESRNKGFVITRVASTSVITNPVLGMLVYDISNSPAPCVKLYSDLGWNCLAKDCLPAATKN